jgi:hypothetical protein
MTNSAFFSQCCCMKNYFWTTIANYQFYDTPFDDVEAESVRNVRSPIFAFSLEQTEIHQMRPRQPRNGGRKFEFTRPISTRPNEFCGGVRERETLVEVVSRIINFPQD